MEIIDVTLNPNDGYGWTLSNGNLTGKYSSNGAIRTTHSKTTGKWYWEIIGGGYLALGVSNKSFNVKGDNKSPYARMLGFYRGIKYPEATAFVSSGISSKVQGIALDLDNGTIEYFKDGMSMGISHTDIKDLGEVFPTFSIDGWQATFTVNFGASPFAYSIPHGFYSYDGRQSSWYDKILISSKDEYYSVIPEVYATETTIPKMTSNTAPSGRAFSSSTWGSGYEPWKAFDRTENHYGSVSGSGGIGHLGYEFNTPIKIGKYAVRSTSSNYISLPKDWTFEGSNDGVVWDVLDTQVNQTWTTANTDKEYFIDISKIGSYKMYRLNWTANGGNSNTNINELKMYQIINFSNITLLPNQSEQTFINHGMNKDTSIDLTSSKILERRFIVQDNTQLGSGKVFKKKIDTTKIPIRGAMIG